MDQKSQMKVMEAGFVILRKDDHPTPRIKVKYLEHPEWCLYAKYTTKAERDREFETLMKSNRYIQD